MILNEKVKRKMFAYFSVSSTRFRMKCHLCVNYIEMQTDPATCDYVIVSGANRKEERWDMADNEQILTTGKGFVFGVNQKINDLLSSVHDLGCRSEEYWHHCSSKQLYNKDI